MLYIILAVLFSVFLLFLFKLFPKYGVNTFTAIIYNYIFAFLTGMIFVRGDYHMQDVISTSWFKLAMPLGSLFIGVLYLISLTTQKVSLSAASIANKMSMVMPVLFSVFFLGQELLWYKIIGILLALFSVYFASVKKEEHHSNGLLLPAAVFIGSGLIDLSLNACNAYFIHNKTESALFSAFIFASAFICGILVITLQQLKNNKGMKDLFSIKNIIGGALLGVPNYFSIYFIFEALDTHIMSSAVLFPFLNVSNVAFSALIGAFLFREKLSKMNIAGILLAVLSVILISI